MSDWKEDAIRHKYAPLPDEPRHKKKAKKQHVRSDHRHEYEVVCVDEGTYVINRTGRHKEYTKAERCKICGRLRDARFGGWLDSPPEGMRLFVVDGITALFDKYLPEDKEVIQ